MDCREASVCFFKMSNLRRNVIGRGGGEGAERWGNPVLCVTSGIITVYRQCQLYHSPCARDKNSKLQCLLLSLYPFGSPVKSLLSLQAGSGSSLRVQLMLACHPFLWCSLIGAYRKAEERHVPRGIHLLIGPVVFMT